MVANRKPGLDARFRFTPSILGACAASVTYWLLYTAICVLNHPGAPGSSLVGGTMTVSGLAAFLVHYGFWPLAVAAFLPLATSCWLMRAAGCHSLPVWLAADGSCGMLLNAALQGISFPLGGSDDSAAPGSLAMTTVLVAAFIAGAVGGGVAHLLTHSPRTAGRFYI